MKEVIYDEKNNVLRKSIIKNGFYLKQKFTTNGLRKLESYSDFIKLEISDMRILGLF